MADNGESLEAAIGIVAVHALRDWLSQRYPTNQPPLDKLGRAHTYYDEVPKPELRTWWELKLCRFHPQEYRSGKRKWWRVMDRVTDSVAEITHGDSQRPMRCEMLVDYDEAVRTVDKLLKEYGSG